MSIKTEVSTVQTNSDTETPRLAPKESKWQEFKMSDEMVLHAVGSNRGMNAGSSKVVWRLKENENHDSKARGSQHDTKDVLRKGGVHLRIGVGLQSALEEPPVVSFAGAIKSHASTRHSLFHAHRPQQLGLLLFLGLVIYFV